MWWLSPLSVTVFLVFRYAIVRFGIISEALLASPEQMLTTFISKLTSGLPMARPSALTSKPVLNYV